jgi:Arc/MetJ-type ribon-helix-helix transcriptional regulator
MANNKRPEDRRSVNVTIRFKQSQIERIDAEAARHEFTTRSDIVRDLIDNHTFEGEPEQED